MRFTSLISTTVVALVGLALAGSAADASPPSRSPSELRLATTNDLAILDRISQGFFSFAPFAIVKPKGAKMVERKVYYHDDITFTELDMIDPNIGFLRRILIMKQKDTGKLRQILMHSISQDEQSRGEYIRAIFDADSAGQEYTGLAVIMANESAKIDLEGDVDKVTVKTSQGITKFTLENLGLRDLKELGYVTGPRIAITSTDTNAHPFRITQNVIAEDTTPDAMLAEAWDWEGQR
ncbi:hypothetical protein THASP1DRAFT_32872 [Thamnocephalis sphaerospora]|uniref:Uncharacterized protein n=1 Tax=Thamnocephalis sphaerospora TaxID=78915 RepID=A0A4P9XHX2_9FUNG|nr:hypothetical protein THASP1DRAFT_32872 [Thamnocephalis sphaerospora]|eukprot:RKP05292.1 hypothetical protein THASP1DRAFT_32872 [Thamnocephalis sphaerospora]